MTPATRLVAPELKTTVPPSPLMAVMSPMPLFAGEPSAAALARRTPPVSTSATTSCRLPSASGGSRDDEVVPNATHRPSSLMVGVYEMPPAGEPSGVLETSVVVPVAAVAVAATAPRPASATARAAAAATPARWGRRDGRGGVVARLIVRLLVRAATSRQSAR